MGKRTILFVLTVILFLSGCGVKDSKDSSRKTSQKAQVMLDEADMFTDRDKEIGYDEQTGAVIELSGNGASCASDAVKISDGTVTVCDEGTYILSGVLDDGMVIVDAEDTDKVQLVLNGAEITNADSAAVYVKNADKVFVTTVSGTKNTLSNGGKYTAIDDNNIDAVIFSKSDLTLNGAGTLTVHADAGHGIVSKDDLVFTSGTYDVTAVSHDFSGKNSVRIADGTYTLVAGEDAVHTENADDASLGFLYIADGSFTVQSADDAFHASSALLIAGGDINIEKSYEGIEALGISITGGTISLVADDDGLNAAGGNDTSGMGRGGGDMFAVTEGAYIKISGGTLHVNASGDGLDSNGDISVTGGEIYVSGPIDNGNGMLDYSGEAVISGGTFIAAGSSGMAQNFGSTSTQGAMLVSVDTCAVGSTLSLCDSAGSELASWQPDKEYTSVLISCPQIVEGETYTLKTGDSTTQVVMESLIYGAGGQAHDGRGGMEKGNGRPEGMPPENGEKPEKREKPEEQGRVL